MELTDERIRLREFLEEDVSALMGIHADPRLFRYYSPELATYEHARMLVDMFINWARENPRDNFQLAIVDRNSNVLLGSCGVRRKGCGEGQAEFGIGIDANCWGRGIAQEAAKLILRFGFTELDLREIRGVSVSENEAVRRFASRLGFCSGVAREGEPWMVERGWKATDWVMTREAWENQAG